MILEAECDGCGTTIKPNEDEELYSLKTGDYCEDCVGFDDLTEEEYEGYD